MPNELTQRRATDLVEGHLRSAIAALSDTPTLRPLRNGRRPCPDPVTGEDGPTVSISRGFWLLDLDPDRTVGHLGTLREHWSDAGFRITADTYPVERIVTVENDDGFTMSVVVSDTGVLSISASSPCAVPDDTAAGPS